MATVEHTEQYKYEQERTRHLVDEARRAGVPEHTVGGLVRWIVYGINPGSFLTAFLSNDLMGALSQADEVNAEHFREIGSFVYNSVPSACHGSREKFEAWPELLLKANEHMFGGLDKTT